MEPGIGAQFAVTDPADGRILGCMGLLHADRGRGQIEAGYWAAPWDRSAGFTRRALRLVTDWALGQGGFDVVGARVELDNPRSMALVRSVGFVPDDKPIHALPLKGSVRYMVSLRITREEWQAVGGAPPVGPHPLSANVV